MIIRPARPTDVSSILALVRELAEYERAPEQVSAAETDFSEALFGTHPRVWCLVAEGDSIVGYAFYFLSFSTWLGRHGIYVEDVYVQQTYRGQGIGTSFLKFLARECVINGYGRLEWSVLDWNSPAWDFYQGLGAHPMDDWTMHRVTGESLRALAEVSDD
jgi:GNAT superfamily N-acetyltransferase